MGRAIAVLSMIVLCSFAFVLLHLTLRKPARAAGLRGPAPVLETREDGSVSSVDIQLSIFEQRLMDAERRSERLATELQQEKKDRQQMEDQVAGLQAELKRLRRQPVGEPDAGAPAAPDRSGASPANAPTDAS